MLSVGLILNISIDMLILSWCNIVSCVIYVSNLKHHDVSFHRYIRYIYLYYSKYVKKRFYLYCIHINTVRVILCKKAKPIFSIFDKPVDSYDTDLFLPCVYIIYTQLIENLNLRYIYEYIVN